MRHIFLGTAELYVIVTQEHRAPQAVQVAVVEAGVARTPGPGRARQKRWRRDVGRAWLSSLKRTHEEKERDSPYSHPGERLSGGGTANAGMAWHPRLLVYCFPR